MKTSLIFSAVLLLLGVPITGASAVFFGPVLYQQRSQSPFYPGIDAGTIYLEDFEDFLLNTPNVTSRGGAPSFRDHGVDEDDGAVDGFGYNTVWHHLPLFPDPLAPWTFDITFQPDAAGDYPKYAGFALLGSTPPTIPLGAGYSLWWAFDPEGNPLSPEPLRVITLPLEGNHYNNTRADQFVGLYNEAGIGKILIGRIPTLDHLQYGWAIPEPTVTVLGGAVAALALWRRRREQAAGVRRSLWLRQSPRGWSG